MAMKVVLVGNSSSGKTLTCLKLLNSLPPAGVTIKPTLGAEVHVYCVSNINCYNLWDCAGKEQYEGLRDGYYIQSNIALIFHGGEIRMNPEEWEREVKRAAPNAQIHHIKGNLEEKYEKVCEILL
jgi:GTP-binding nuclear protein Ran